MQKRRLIFLYTLAFLFHLFGSLATYHFSDFPAPIDELGHYSYVAHLAEKPSVFPDYEAMAMLEGPNFITRGEETNYHYHPSFYYWLMVPFMDKTQENAFGSIQAMRLANIALSSMAVGIALFVGFSLFSGSGAKVVFAFSLVLFSKLAVVGGLINNDNLALLAATIVLAGLAFRLKYRAEKYTLLIAAGFVLACLSKLTAGVMLGLVVGFYELICWVWLKERLAYKRVLAYGVAGLIGLIPYIHNFMLYGDLTPVDESVYRNEINLGAPKDSVDFLWTHFLQSLAFKWSAFEPANTIQVSGLVVFLMVMGFAGIASFTHLQKVNRQGLIKQYEQAKANWPEGLKPSHSGVIALSFLLAFVSTLVIHGGFALKSYIAIGDDTMGQARYYNALWPGLAIAAAYALSHIKSKRLFCVVAVLVLLLLLVSTVQFQLFV